MGNRSRTKGNGGEIEVAKAICREAGLNPWREHIRTTRDVVGGNQQEQAGDLVAVSEPARKLLHPWKLIEVKTPGRKLFNLEMLFRQQGYLREDCVLTTWLRKMRGSLSGTGHVGVLILNMPRLPFLCVYEADRFVCPSPTIPNTLHRFHVLAPDFLSSERWEMTSLSDLVTACKPLMAS